LSNASLQGLGAWLVDLAHIQHQGREPYHYYGEASKPDLLIETAMRWGLEVETIKAAITEQRKPKQRKKRSIP